MDKKHVSLKARTGGFKDTTNLRAINAGKRAVIRSNARNNAFARGRNLVDLDDADIEEEDHVREETTDYPAAKQTDARRIRLEKWKLEKLQKVNLAKAIQKPVFKIGVVHHSVGSPSVFGVPSISLNLNPTRKGATTRAMKSNVQVQPIKCIQPIPWGQKFKPPIIVKPTTFLTIPNTPKGMSARKKVLLDHHCASTKVSTTIQLARGGNVKTSLFKAKGTPAQTKTPKPSSSVVIPKSINIVPPSVETQLSPGQVLKMYPKSPAHVAFKFSPNVTIERGNYSDRRKSLKSRLSCTPTASKSPANDGNTIDLSDGIKTLAEKENSKHPAAHFRSLLDTEVGRLEDMCEEWTKLRSELPANISDDVLSLIDLAVGQSKLLIRSKFEQFRGLTFDCEKGVCIPPVTPLDLQGFWDLVYIQVDAIDKRFQDLTELKGNNFVLKTRAITPKKKTVPKKAPNRAAPRLKQTGIRALIEAGRRKKLEENGKSDTVVAPEKTPLKPRTSMSSTSGLSSKRSSLIQDVLKRSALRRSQHISPIIMRVTNFAKGIASPTASKTDSTPKSILKDISTLKAGRKTVNFAESTIRNLSLDFIEQAENDSLMLDQPKMSISNLTVRAERLTGPMEVDPASALISQAEALPTVETTPLKKRSRRASQNTPDIKTIPREGNKENHQTHNPMLFMSEQNINFDSPAPMKTRRSFRKTPYKKAVSQDGIKEDQASLPQTVEPSSPLPIDRHFSGFDLISFDTPVRRSSRLCQKLK